MTLQEASELGVFAFQNLGRLPSGRARHGMRQFPTVCPVFLHYLRTIPQLFGGEGRYVDFGVMCTKWGKCLQILATGDAQVHINPDLQGTRTDCRRSGMRPLALWADEVLQHPHPEDQQSFQGLVHYLRGAAVVSAGSFAQLRFRH